MSSGSSTVHPNCEFDERTTVLFLRIALNRTDSRSRTATPLPGSARRRVEAIAMPSLSVKYMLTPSAINSAGRSAGIASSQARSVAEDATRW